MYVLIEYERANAEDKGVSGQRIRGHGRQCGDWGWGCEADTEGINGDGRNKTA